jgi:hypothetical protein
MRTSSVILVAAVLANSVVACGGGSDSKPTPPAVPTDVSTVPTDGKLNVAWTQVAGATSYDVFYATTPNVTASSAKVTSTSPVAILSAANGAPLYVAVTAVNATGSSGLSPVACGVPSPGGEPTSSYEQVDDFCGSTWNGSAYREGLQSRRIVNGALELQLTSANLEAGSARGVRKNSAVAVANAGGRVTALRAAISVPDASTATRTGTATINAQLSIQYQPIANRLSFPGGLAKNVFANLGLVDSGSGLRFQRSIGLCANPSCGTLDTTTGITYADGTFPENQPASYGTPYTFTMSFDEAARVFTYSVSGPGLAGVLTGTADASALFAAQGVAPSDQYLAQLRSRVSDAGAGGSAGSMRATFDDASIGVNGGALAPRDDFSGAEIDPSRWGVSDAAMALGTGALELATRLPANGSAATAMNSLVLTPIGFSSPPSHVRVDVTFAPNTAAAPGTENRFVLNRALYNDGTVGVAPNLGGANSSVGDVQVQVVLTPTTARFQLLKTTTPTFTSASLVTLGPIDVPVSPSRPLGAGTTHTLRVSWDLVARTVTVQLDDAAPVTVNPTVGGPEVVAPAPLVDPTPHGTLLTLIGVSATNPGSAPGTAAGTIRLNNLFAAP